jgi:hypothetical protein
MLQGGQSNKRLSQIVYHSGFLNRLADAPSSHHVTLTKGWKPFKAEVKGSKLHFWKPPSDRSAGIKELFPTELVPAMMEEEEEGDAGSQAGDTSGGDRDGALKGKGKDDTIGRKKRAFWGRRTHPEIVKGEDGIGVEKGTFEALVHETAFGTTFGLGVKKVPEGEAGEPHIEKWRNFASSVILCLPSIAGQSRFEAEFLRCCSYLVSGADEDVREAERERVGWLAGEYLRYHGKPVDRDAWEEWRADTIPHTLSGVVKEASGASGLPTSSSMQAMHPSPLLQSSPNVGVFSPRPEESTSTGSTSLMTTLKRDGAHAKRGDAASRTTPWTSSLAQEGLSRDVLRMLDPHLMAHTLLVYHRSVMDQLPDDLTADLIIESDEPQSPGATTTAFSSLLGTEDQPHWLTKLVLLQVLGADTSGGQSQENRLSRSDVISIWVRVGELCRLAGDECSWRAIFSALCSRPVARLDKTWRGIGRLPLSVVESWVYPMSSEKEPPGAKEPKVTPWGADIRAKVKEELGKAMVESEEGILIGPLEDVRKIFEGFRTTFGLCPRRVPLAEEPFGVEEINKLVAFWAEMAREGGGVGSAAVKFQRSVLTINCC